MNKNDLKIVFMGTPDFAVESLRVLVENKYNVVGVVTMPDKPAGRGHKIQYSAVKTFALEYNLPLLQPEKLKDESFINDLKSLNADLQIVVAFRMLPEVVWDMPPLGTFNLHASLLPQYRGAAPINWAIMNGEKETGATTFFLTHEIDTGNIILQEKVPIGDSDNVGKIHDDLMTMGGQLVKNTVDLIIGGKASSIAQNDCINESIELKNAPKIYKETCKIDWNQPSEKIYNKIRGLSPYPVAWTELINGDKFPISIKIFKATVEKSNTPKTSVGTIITDNKTYIKVACNDGFIDIKQLQLPGKKIMNTEELLRGYKFENNSLVK